jgi:PhzF family phenazine biosynthesis protein
MAPLKASAARRGDRTIAEVNIASQEQLSMAQTVRVFQVDAFTSRVFSGNPAGVVLDADDLSADAMQAIARELNNGDTAFVLRPDGDDHDLRVRFFTPRKEAAFVGHATVAVHAVRSALGLAACSRQKQLSGIVTVDTLDSGSSTRIVIHQSAPSLRRTLSDDELAELLTALAIPRAALDVRCPATIAGDSSQRVLLALQQGTSLTAVQPDFARLSALSARLDVPGFFLFSLRPAVPDVYTEARMFAPALGIPEDPVSGNAHAMLGALLCRHNLLGLRDDLVPDTDTVEFTGAQGHHLGRPGRVGVALNLQQRRLESVSIVGEAAIVFSAVLEF